MTKSKAIIDNMLTAVQSSILPERVMKIPSRSIDPTMGRSGCLKKVMARRFLKHNYTHLQVSGVKRSVYLTQGLYSEIVWLLPLNS